MMSSKPESDALAQASDAAHAGPTEQFLTFAVRGERYAAAIQFIREIIEVPPMTVMPLVPGFVRGVINLRGSVVPVIDLSARLELGATDFVRQTCIVVVEVSGEAGDEAGGGGARRDDHQVLGILVDSVQDVLDIGTGQIEKPPALGARVHPEFISGVVSLAGELLVVLNLECVLAQPELARLVAGFRSH